MGPKTCHHLLPQVETDNSFAVSLTLKLGLLKHLDLANIDVVQGVDGLAGLLNVLANAVWDPGTQHVTF